MTDKEAQDRAYLLRGMSMLGVTEAQVAKWRVEGDSLVVIVDNGIKGSPKYILPLDKLPELPPPDMSQAPPVVEDIEQGEMHAPPQRRGRKAK